MNAMPHRLAVHNTLRQPPEIEIRVDEELR
ncbi:hypothetical protein JOD27_008471 [Lentzea nigeriaca]|nr:hypothetical protein [Lentzea nigeriaca]